MKVTRGGVITGRVVDDEGDPVTGAFVSLFRMTKGGRRSRNPAYQGRGAGMRQDGT